MSTNIKNFARTRRACYFTYLAMSSVFSLPPLLFVTFREMYGISYTLLGTLVLINFCTQLTIDLIFSFFTKYFNIHLTVRVMPLLTSAGLLTYALVPMLFPQYAYLGFVTGTVIFSVAAGLCEVLLSPLVAALPSDNPERDMSKLHSLYAYGVVMVVLVSTAFLKLFGNHNWMYLTLFWAVLPIFSFILFSTSPFPEMDLSSSDSKGKSKHKNGRLMLCVLCIFFGSAAENSMTNWISGYMENALQIPKMLGDILGMALFAVLIGLGRTLYAKYGKNISLVLLVSMAGAFVCYLFAGLSTNPIIAMVACILTGICTSMLWPGALILMEEKIPNPGVAAYALMAAGGDFGASIAPQMLGAIVDMVSASTRAPDIASQLSISTEQLGMKAGMLTAAAFPFIGIFILIYIRKAFKKSK
ncbi:MAG: MFS transporter [Clostridia bacterium]|nr:MFS transporter [Clostridia bacterium]